MKWPGRRAIRLASSALSPARCTIVDESQAGAEPVTIAALQRRTGNDRRSVDLGTGRGDGIEPAPAHGVVQRLATAHGGDVLGRMVAVRFHEGCRQSFGQDTRNGGLAAAGDAHRKNRVLIGHFVPSRPTLRRSFVSDLMKQDKPTCHPSMLLI